MIDKIRGPQLKPVLKSPEIFYDPNRRSEICYVPEVWVSRYSHNDFLLLCDGDEERACELFELVVWEHPETIMQRRFNEDIWCRCPKCKSICDVQERRRAYCKYCEEEFEYVP